MAQNDYYTLMSALQAPAMQKREEQIQLINQLAGLGARYLAQTGIQSKISNADKNGEKVSYTIDPNTGMQQPTFSKNNYESVFEALKDPAVADKYELGRGSKGEPRLIKKKTVKSNVIEGIKSALTGDKTDFLMKNPATMQDEKINISNEADVDKAMQFLGIENWKENPEMVEAGIPKLYSERMKLLKESTEKIEAGAEPKIQPFTNSNDVLGRSVGGKAFYKDAVAKYGEPTTTQIVNIAAELQKKGMPISKIEDLMKEKGIDPDVILGAYNKK